MTTSMLMVLESAVTKCGVVDHNGFVSLVAKCPIATTSGSSQVNPLGVRSRIATLGTFGSGLNDAPTLSAASKASLKSGKSWFKVERPT